MKCFLLKELKLFTKVEVVMVSLLSTRNIKTEIGTRSGVIVVTDLTMLLGGMWALGLWIRKVLKWGLVGHTRRSREDSDTESNVDYDGLTQVVLKEKNISK